MTSFDDLKNRTLAAIDQIAAELDGEPSGQHGRLTDVRRRLVDGRFHVVVCGEFKRGKSNLLNALVDVRELCPTDVDIATNVLSTISYGETEQITVHVGPVGKATPRLISRAELSEFVTEGRNGSNRRQVRGVEIRLPNARLEHGLVLVDTPGVGGVNVEHTAVTYGFLPLADAVIFVCDAVEPLSTIELEFLGDIAGHCSTIITAVTKIDMVVDPDPVVSATRVRVAKALGQADEDVVVIGVSSVRKLNGVEQGDRELVDASGFAELERELWNGIGSRSGALLLLRALADIDGALSLMRGPIEVELAALRQSSEAKLSELERELARLGERSRQLSAKNADWTTDVGKALAEVRKHTTRQLDDVLDHVEDRFQNEYLENEPLLRVPEEIARMVVRDIALAVAEAGKELARGASQVLGDAADATSLSFKAELPQINWSGEADLPRLIVPRPRTSGLGKVLNTTRGGTTGLRTGGLLGGALGAAIGSVVPVAGTWVGFQVGSILGALVGGAVGGHETFKRLRDADTSGRREAVRKVLQPVIKRNRKNAAQSLTDFADALQTGIIAELTGRVAQERAAVRRTIESVKATRHLTHTEAGSREADLTARAARTLRIASEISILREAVLDVTADDAAGSRMVDSRSRPVRSGDDLLDLAEYDQE